MTREEAKEILRHWDDIAWLEYNNITCGQMFDALRNAEDALSNPWHKVSEDLPKETCEVLICWETVKHERKWTRKIMFRRDASNPEIGYFDDNEDGVVTPDYWMPIPELPTED